MCCRCLLCCGASFVVGFLGVAGLALLQWPNGNTCGRTCQARPLLRNAAAGLGAEARCALRRGLSWSDFREKGFTVVPGFLSEEERGVLLDIYDGLQDDSVTNPGGNAGHKAGYRSTWLAGLRTADFLPKVAERIRNITADALPETGIDISHPYFEEMFFTTNSSDWSRSMRFGWHQDVENHFFFQDLRNYLDFYLFLRKPDPRQAGITLVPWDSLRLQSPELYRLAKAERSVLAFHDAPPSRMVAVDASTDANYLLDYHLDQISCSPELRAGDLLLFAGDVIHRTQEHSSWRISLNINVHQDSAKGAVSFAEMLTGGATKYSFMAKNPGTYVDLHKHRVRVQQGIDPASAKLRALDAALRAAISAGFEYRKALLGVRALLSSWA